VLTRRQKRRRNGLVHFYGLNGLGISTIRGKKGEIIGQRRNTEPVVSFCRRRGKGERRTGNEEAVEGGGIEKKFHSPNHKKRDLIRGRNSVVEQRRNGDDREGEKKGKKSRDHIGFYATFSEIERGALALGRLREGRSRLKAGED